VLYPRAEILLLMLCATIAGADDFVEIGLWGGERQDFLRRFLPYEHGTPSHDTLCDVIAAVDPDAFKACFLAWEEGLRADIPDIIAIDGKTSRRSHDRRKGRLPLHTVSAWASQQRLVLGRAPVTIDAMGNQKGIPSSGYSNGFAVGALASLAQTIIDGGADYVLALKENWPATYVDVEKVFADPPAIWRLSG
jgi:hypothetical protein